MFEIKSNLPQKAKDLFEKNKSYFSDLNPEFIEKLENMKALQSELEYRDEAFQNIKINNNSLYQVSSEDFCNEQLNLLKTTPDRIVFDDLKYCNLSPISKGFMEQVNFTYFDSKEDFKFASAPIRNSGYFFLLGLGSGQIVEKILQNLKIKHLCIVEPIFEFFIQSLFIVDWEKLYALAEEKGIVIHLYFHKEPYRCVEALETTVRDVGNTFIEGSYFLVHYPSWELKETYRFLRERIAFYYFTTGYFEDELVMMRNSYMNLMRKDFKYLKRQRYLQQDYPVFVVASGPSLEYDLPYLKKIRDQVILVSSGTTLALLLNHGLRPDYHAELENVEHVYKMMKSKADEFGFQGITLMASSSVDPRFVQLFDDVYFFARGAISSTSIFFDDMESLNEVAPVSANTALSCIATLGFRNLYLAGVDCGRPIGANHHAPGSIYEELGKNEHIEEITDFERVVPGNFGGQVTTTVFLDASRRSITSLINRLNLKINNCSHGAKIDQAAPLSIGAVKLKNKPGQQDRYKALAADQMQSYKAGEYVDHTPFKSAAQRTELLKEEISKFIQECRENSQTMFEFKEKIDEFWHKNWDELGYLLIIMGGSFSSMIRLGTALGSRIVEEAEMDNFHEAFYSAFEKQSCWMVDQLKLFYEAMGRGDDKVALPKWYELETPLDLSGVDPDKLFMDNVFKEM